MVNFRIRVFLLWCIFTALGNIQIVGGQIDSDDQTDFAGAIVGPNAKTLLEFQQRTQEKLPVPEYNHIVIERSTRDVNQDKINLDNYNFEDATFERRRKKGRVVAPPIIASFEITPSINQILFHRDNVRLTTGLGIPFTIEFEAGESEGSGNPTSSRDDEPSDQNDEEMKKVMKQHIVGTGDDDASSHKDNGNKLMALRLLRRRRSIKDRVTVFKGLANALDRWGVKGEECVCRAICETAEAPIVQDGLVGEIVNVLLQYAASLIIFLSMICHKDIAKL